MSSNEVLLFIVRIIVAECAMKLVPGKPPGSSEDQKNAACHVSNYQQSSSSFKLSCISTDLPRVARSLPNYVSLETEKWRKTSLQNFYCKRYMPFSCIWTDLPRVARSLPNYFSKKHKNDVKLACRTFLVKGRCLFLCLCMENDVTLARTNFGLAVSAICLLGITAVSAVCLLVLRVSTW